METKMTDNPINNRDNEYLEVAIHNAFNAILRLADGLGQSHTVSVAERGLAQLHHDIKSRNGKPNDPDR